MTATAAAPDVHRPALIALARDDGFVTVAAERRLYAALGTRSKLLVLLPAGAGYGWDLLERPGGDWSAFERTLTRFLAAHARAAPPRARR